MVGGAHQSSSTDLSGLLGFRRPNTEVLSVHAPFCSDVLQVAAVSATAALKAE
jgi:hypothetical protein